MEAKKAKIRGFGIVLDKRGNIKGNVPLSYPSTPGKYDICPPNKSCWRDIEVYRKGYALYFTNPENNIETCVKSLHGWKFLRK